MRLRHVLLLGWGVYSLYEAARQRHGKPESILDIALNFGLHLEHGCNCAYTPATLS
jgi:hypothetical protein